MTRGGELACRGRGRDQRKPLLTQRLDLPRPQENLRAGDTSVLFQTNSLYIKSQQSKPGTYEISTSTSGVSRLRIFPSFIEPREVEWMFEQLHREIPWRQKSNVGPDGPYQEPRLTCWYGEVPYTYSRSTMQANPHWHPLLTMLKDRIGEVTGYNFNSLLCNLYRHDKDSIDWHSDDEPDLGRDPVIASLSFGETRVFQMRKKPPQEEQGDYTYVERIHIPLDRGTLLIMEGATQSDWQHRVPKEYHDRQPRINLTFRTMFPETKAQP
ncbi:PREDICTED: alpha-ketoglutarate-dependent dioxygenase alkB homolog 3 isoform X2 [Nanorana parkeri]|uniref:alpha-ketoglutarate-dependent dioxygenase alkB homolog 3 isoform X2 n=1 Tax=Nanorana parkeri TaxID=125878 RepID=UPI00085405D1|nr:PREDICTED: alpha-ketoglutarate-dependent dioxygenase alkB homolog 3 isoform X2 [Nanorana parkeri]